MTRGRKPDPHQLALVPDPGREEDKQLVRMVTYASVVVYCSSRSITVPTAAEWRNAQEVLTYMIHVRTDRGIFPRIETIAARAFEKPKSQPVVERAISLLKRLGALSSTRRGRNSNEYQIHFNWLAEIRAAAVSPTHHSTRHLVTADPSRRRIERSEMTDRMTENDGSTIRGFNQEPTFNQPTTTTLDAPEWVVVVEGVRSCGVNQAAAAVGFARSRGATPGDVRAIVAQWQGRRAGWEHAAHNLYRRLQQFDRAQPPAEGWPAFDESYQAQLARADGDRRRRDQLDRTLATRRQNAEERERSLRERREQGLSLVDMAAEIDPSLAEGIRQARRRSEARGPPL